LPALVSLFSLNLSILHHIQTTFCPGPPQANDGVIT
jgi:hypothetical protein